MVKSKSKTFSKVVREAEKISGTSIMPYERVISISELREIYPVRHKGLIEIIKSSKSPTYDKDKGRKTIQMLKLLNNLGNYLLVAEKEGEKILLPRQLETFQKIYEFLEKGNTEGHVVLPTGIGKSVIFSRLLESATRDNPMKFLVVGPTKIILHQNRWKLGEFGDIEAGLYYGNEKDLTKQVTLTTYASLRNGLKFKNLNPKSFDAIIFDEAHRALGEETISAIEEFPREVIKIGFTATPEFHEEKSVADILPITIDELKLKEAIKGNLLAGLKVYFIPTKVNVSGVKRVGNQYAEDSLGKCVNTPKRNRLVVDVYNEQDIFRGKRTVVYCSGRQHGKDITTTFLERDIPASYIDGETSDAEREKIFSQFKKGEVKVLCNPEVLIEGFDEPEAEICINASPTLSRVVAEQRGGRVLRRSKLYDGKIGRVVEIVDYFGKSENTPILFSEIAGAAEILPDKSETKSRRKKVNIRKNREISKPKKRVQVTAVVYDPQEIMMLTNKNRRQRYTKEFHYAPNGWVHPRQLAHECRVKERSIKEFAEKDKEKNPNFYQKFLTSTEMLITHYHPDLVDLTRRHFIKGLTNTVTAEEYADKHNLPKEKAENMLVSAEEKTLVKPKRFGDKKYYPESEYKKIVLKEARLQRDIENREILDAEEEFWLDGDLSDKEKERIYWERFDDICIEEEKNICPYWQPFRTQFNDDLHQSVASSNTKQIDFDRLRTEIMKVLNALDANKRDVIIKRFFEDKKYKEIARETGVSTAAVGFRLKDGIELLRLPQISNPLRKIYYDNDSVSEVEEEKIKEFFTISRLYKVNYSHLSKAFVGLETNAQKSQDSRYDLIVNSIMPSDLECLRNTAPLKYNDRGKLSLAFHSLEVKALILGFDIKSIKKRISPDGKMIKAYDPSDIKSCILYLKSRRFRSEEQERRLKELYDLKLKYETHFGSL